MNRRVFFNRLLNVTAGAAAATFAVRFFPDPTAAAPALQPLTWFDLDHKVQPLFPYNEPQGYAEFRRRHLNTESC